MQYPPCGWVFNIILTGSSHTVNTITDMYLYLIVYDLTVFIILNYSNCRYTAHNLFPGRAVVICSIHRDAVSYGDRSKQRGYDSCETKKSL